MKLLNLQRELARLRTHCSTLEAVPTAGRVLLVDSTPEERFMVLTAIELTLKKMRDALIASNKIVEQQQVPQLKLPPGSVTFVN